MRTSVRFDWKLALAFGLPVAALATIGVVVYVRRRRTSARLASSGENALPGGIVVARDYPNSLRQPVSVVTEVSSPRYVAISKDGNLFVSSSRNHCVFVYDSNGQRQATIGCEGTGELQFKHPLGIAIVEDVVYVVENGNDRVQCFTTSGEFIRCFGCFGSSDGQFNRPVGICAGSGGYMYVSDSGNDRVQVFDSNGRFSHSIVGQEPFQRDFRSPFGLAFSPNGDLHVAMYSADRVLVLNSLGQCVRRYDAKYPAGLAMDRAGFSLVSSICNEGSLSVYDPSGDMVHRAEGFDYPCGVCVAEDGSVWLAERNNHRLLKY